MAKRDFYNMTDYVRENLCTFEEAPFCEVDSMVLSWISYLEFQKNKDIEKTKKGVGLADIYHLEEFDELFSEVWSKEETLEMLTLMLASPRFRNLRLSYYVEETDEKKQFAALTIRLNPELAYIAFRGTDRSFVGWKEDFRLALTEPIPSQQQAIRYLNMVAKKYPGKLILGGHSKGGNLAVYAAANVDEKIQNRILAIYSHDGPGFRREDMETEGFKRIKGRICKSMPRFSVVGILFEQEAQSKIAISHEKGVLQHYTLSWEIEGGRLKEQEDLSKVSKLLHQKTNALLVSMSEEEKNKLIDTMFAILESTGTDNFRDFGKDLTKNVHTLLDQTRHLSPENRKFILQILKLLMFSHEEEIKDEEMEIKDTDDPSEVKKFLGFFRK